MKLIIILSGILFLSGFRPHMEYSATDTKLPVYNIARLKRPMKIDGNWDKPQWRHIEAIKINNFIREVPGVQPVVEARMGYDAKNLFVIFRVQDRYVRSIAKELNGPVWKDAAVEFFFSPDTNLPGNYFNLEMNCGGTALLGYHTATGKKPGPEDTKMIEIAHSLPQVVDPEITEPVTWNLECRIPLAMLEKYSNVTHPAQGVSWRANFYKIAENNSNPHHMSWSVIEGPKPNFHKPQYFGIIKFQ